MKYRRFQHISYNNVVDFYVRRLNTNTIGWEMNKAILRPLILGGV